jgi:HK97 family phage major capsid protein
VPQDNETLVIESAESIKSIEVKDGKARVGAYAIRFSGADQKDLQGEFFTAKTYFGSRKGDGADVMFNHGQAPTKAFDEICGRVFAEAKATLDEVGIFVEHVLDLADEYEAAIAGLCSTGKLKWSSGATSHMVKRSDTGEIKRWPIAEFSYTPTPAEPRLPAIAPLKSVTVDEASAAEIAKGLPNAETEKGRKGETGKSPDVTVKVGVEFVDAKTGKPVDNPLQAVPHRTLITTTMTPEEKAAKDAADKAQADAAQKSVDDRVAAREKEISEIYEIGDAINDRELARKAIKDGTTIDELRKHVLETHFKAKPVDPDAGLVGMSGKETKSYSLIRAMFSMATKGRLEGLEKEAHEAAIKTLGREMDSKGFFVPDDVTRSWGRVPLKAANQVTLATSGGFLVQTDLGPMIELLRNKPQVVAAGATTLGGLVGDVALPVQTGTTTAYWVSELGALTDSNSVFGQKKLTPKRLGATIPYTTQFLAQTTIDAESFVQNDATTVLNIEKDRAALLGTGADGQPVGIANTTGINADVTYNGLATWAKVVLSETGIGNDNADIGPMAWVLDSATVGQWKSTLKTATYGSIYLIENGTANGYPIFKTNQVNSAHQSFFGVWSQLIMASWSGLEVIVDPYALKKSGQVEITFNELVDQLVRQPLSFNVSTDTAAAAS